MTEKLFSKAAIKTVLLKEFDNDPRITDELLFKDSRMTLECYVLLKSLFPRRGYYAGNILDDLGYHCYIIFEFDENMRDKNTKQRVIVNKKMENVYKRLDKIVGENGCYMVSDCISGERDGNNEHGNRSHSYSSNKEYLYIDIWIFSREASFLTFADNNDTKCQLLLENE